MNNYSDLELENGGLVSAVVYWGRLLISGVSFDSCVCMFEAVRIIRVISCELVVSVFRAEELEPLTHTKSHEQYRDTKQEPDRAAKVDSRASWFPLRKNPTTKHVKGIAEHIKLNP